MKVRTHPVVSIVVALLAIALVVQHRATAQESLFLTEAGPPLEQVAGAAPPWALDFEPAPAAAAVPVPVWRAQVGALLLARNSTRGGRAFRYLMFDPYPLNRETFCFPLSASVDFGLRRRLYWGDVDFRYFGVQSTSADLGPVPGFDWFGPYDTSATLQSSLQNAELNLRRELTPDIALLAGFRYVQFREHLLVRQTASFSPSDNMTFGSESLAQNEMLGLQLGIEGLLLTVGDRFRFTGGLKSGLLGNATSTQRWFSTIGDGDDFLDGFGSNGGAVSFVGDANLACAVQLTERLALRGGYQLLWLAGVATAGRQHFHGPVTNGSVFFHGATVGLEYTW